MWRSLLAAICFCSTPIKIELYGYSFSSVLALHHFAGVFYYSGAATAAGQSYTGALLVSRDGSWPEEGVMDRVAAAFDTCGIKMWELYEVRATSCCVSWFLAH